MKVTMTWEKKDILTILDQCAKDFTFPALDHGYVYLAKTKMTLFRSEQDWAIAIEVFGFSPRAGVPDIHIYNFSNNLYQRNSSSNYVSEEAYQNYLKQNPHNESRFFYPIKNQDWQIEEEQEFTKEGGICLFRDQEIKVPTQAEYQEIGIELEEERPLTFEFCRYIAAKYPKLVSATEEERRASIQPEMKLLLELEDWHHPDILGGESPSDSISFQQIAEVLHSNNPKLYDFNTKGNTHWSNWPEGGLL